MYPEDLFEPSRVMDRNVFIDRSLPFLTVIMAVDGAIRKRLNDRNFIGIGTKCNFIREIQYHMLDESGIDIDVECKRNYNQTKWDIYITRSINSNNMTDKVHNVLLGVL